MFNFFQCAFVVGALMSTLSMSKPNLKWKVKGEDTTVISLPVTYYSPNQYSLSTSTITYAQFIQCPNSTANNPYISISILQPTNVNFALNLAFAVMEVSTCENSFSDDCVIAANYIYNNNLLQQAYNSIVIPYNNTQSTLYFRLLAVRGLVGVALHITYVANAQVFTGQHNSAVFGTTNGGSGWLYFNQLVKTDEIDTVDTGYSNYYYVSFCQNAIISTHYTVTITVTSAPSTPLAGFDLAGCSVSSVTVEECQVYNKINGIVASESAASTTSVELDSGDNSYSLLDGIFINVNGYGGELDLANDYLLSIIEAPAN